MDRPGAATTPGEPTGEWFDAMPQWRTGQRLPLIVFGLLFACAIAAGPLTWALLRPVQTVSSVPRPEWSLHGFLKGHLMRELEQHLRESSWVTFELRGHFNETLLRLGLLESERVTFGRDGWMFLPETMRWLPAELERTRERRRAILRQALAAARSAGIELLVLPVPDKVTIHPEFAGDVLDPGRARLYDEILADLSAAGVPHLDLRSVFRAHRSAHPDDLLYGRRDTHWCLTGQLVAAGAVRQRIAELGWDELVRREPAIAVLERRAVDRIPDLVRQLGLRFEVDADPAELPSFVRALAEPVESRLVVLRPAGGAATAIAIEQPEATVALCGSSFSGMFGTQLIAALGALVDRRGVVPGGAAFRGIRHLIDEIARGRIRPRVVVWEFVEREYQSSWLDAESLLE